MLNKWKLAAAGLFIGMLFAPMASVTAADKAGVKAGVTVSGTIKVYKTKAKTKGPKSYKDVVVYLLPEGGNKIPVPKNKEPAEMDQEGMVYIPHVLVIQKGGSVKFLNNDNETHNVFSPDAVNEHGKKGFDLGSWGQGGHKTYTFNKAGAATILCKLHLEMAAYIVVVDTPYFTMAEIDGATQKASFSIKNVPPGKYTLKIWHKKLKLKGGDRKIEVKTDAISSIALKITKKKYAR